MSLKNVDIDSALRRLAEKRIEEAMQAGKFDNLEGMGRPLELEPMPADANARLTWWAVRILKRNDVVPDEIKWRKAVDQLRVRLVEAREEKQVRDLVGVANELIRKINTLGTNVMRSGVAPWDLEEELEAFRARRGGE